VNVILFVYIFYKVVNSTDKLRMVLFLACAGSGLYSAYSLIRGSLESERLFFGEMFDPNDLAFFAISFLPLNILLIKRQNPLWMRLGGLACFLVEIALVLQTGSRGGFLALGVVALAMLFARGGTITPIIKTTVVLFLVVAIGYAAINVDRYRSLADIDQDYNLSAETGRLAIWQIGIRTMFSHPVTGVGVGCFPLAVSLDRKARGLDSTRWQTAHNSVILIGAETGLAGLVLFLVLSAGVVKAFVRARKAPDGELLRSIGEMGLIGFVGMFVACLFLSQAYSFYWAFYVAFSAVATRLARRQLLNQPSGV
jgi:O-antigen ligase